MAAFWVYLLGMASLMLSDILVTASFSNQQIALWADVRALFGILATLVTLGLEMVIVRVPSASRLLLKLICLHGIILGVPIGYFAHGMGYLASPWVAAFLAMGAAFSLTQGQYFRSHNHFFLSQLAQQSWRFAVVIALAVIVLTQRKDSIPLDGIVVASIFIFSLLGWLAVIYLPPPEPDNSGSIWDHYRIGFRFLATNILLSIALFGEQLVINGLGTVHQAALYFTHITYFSLPVSLVTAFVGFRLSPWLRDNPRRFSQFLSQYRLSICLVVYFGTATIHMIGWIGWHLIEPSAGSPDKVLMLMFYISSVARNFYIFPSAYNGMFAEVRQQDVLIFAQVLMLAVIGVVLFALSSISQMTYLVAASGALNWVARTAIAGRVMMQLMEVLAGSPHGEAKQ